MLATSPDFAPYEFEDLRKTGQEAIVGADIDLAKHIAEQLGVELVIEPMDFGSVVAAVTQGKADMAISGLAPRPDRAEAMELSSGYNRNTSGYQGFMVLAENADQYTTLEDFVGKKIASQNGSLQNELVIAQIGDFIDEPVSSLNDGIMMLKTGKVDVLAMSSTTGQEYASNYPELVMSSVKFDYESVGNVIGVQKGETELIEEINKIVVAMEEEGLYGVWVDENLALAKELKLVD